MSEQFSGRGGMVGGLSGGVKAAAVALLVHQLMRHSRGNQQASPTEGAGASGGGLGDMLGGLLGGGGGMLGGLLGGGGGGGGMAGAGSGGMLGGLLGGLGGLLGGLRSQGLGQQVDSWVSQGPNQPVSPAELERSLDPTALDEAARHGGTDRGTLLEEMSRMLPRAVDQLTPNGRLPERADEVGGSGIGDVLRRLAGEGTEPRR